MLPGTIVPLVDLLSSDDQLAPAKQITLPLSVMNNLMNHMIYSCGMADTRDDMIKTLKNLRAYCTNILCNNCQ